MNMNENYRRQFVMAFMSENIIFGRWIGSPIDEVQLQHIDTSVTMPPVKRTGRAVMKSTSLAEKIIKKYGGPLNP